MPAAEPMLMIFPLPFFLISGATAWQKNHGPSRLIDLIFSHSSAFTSCTGLNVFQPAQFTKMSTVLKRPRVQATASVTLCCLRTSTVKATASPPSSQILFATASALS